MSPTVSEADRPALRIVHLMGGYRAFDLGDDEIRIGPDFDRHMMRIPNQPYNDLYQVLAAIGLRLVGVDFISGRSQLALNLPPDFQVVSLSGGFAALWGERAWSDVKNVKEQKTRDILDLSGRFTTYHRLLTLRIRELSEAYCGCLLAKLTDIDGKYKAAEHGILFSNGFQVHIEAALHAFLADATALRDLIAEAIWHLVLKEASRDVTTFSTLLKKTRTRTDQHPLLAMVHQAGADRGWLKILTELRNAVTHIAPLGNTHELHLSQIRMQPLKGGSAPMVHYPLTMADGSVRPRVDPIDFDDPGEREERLRVYRSFVENSGDALAYACQCAGQLVSLASAVRTAAGLKNEMRKLTDADIIGPARFHRPQEGDPVG